MLAEWARTILNSFPRFAGAAGGELSRDGSADQAIEGVFLVGLGCCLLPRMVGLDKI